MRTTALRYKLKPMLWIGLCSLSLLLQGAEPDRVHSSLFEEALSVSKEMDPDTDLSACRKTYAELLAKIKVSLEAERAKQPGIDLKPEAVVAVLDQEILVGREVSYISNTYWRDSIFTSALTKKRGNCVSTSLLFYLIGKDLNLPLRMAFLPEHAFARWDDGKTVLNIETTARGRLFTPESAMRRFALTEEDFAPNFFMISLNDKQILAHLEALWSGVFYSLGQRDKAHGLLAQARLQDPACTLVSLKEAGFMMTEGQHEKAREIYRRLMTEAKGPWAKAASVLQFSGFLESRGQIDDSISILEENYANAPLGMKLKMMRQIGTLYRYKRDFEKAIKLYRLVAQVKADERNLGALGSALSEGSKFEEAVEIFERASKLNPDNFFTKIELALLYERLGDKEKGRAAFAKIEEPRSNKLGWHRSLAFYYASLLNEEMMLKHMAEAFKLDASGSTYQYFVREQEMDRYRNHESFIALMNPNKPAAAVLETTEQ